ncbi:MAG: hemerythrin domain-containing protein [Clostridiales bacterium]|nr:hemerythrin domain-containing protein [Clostridiales bacterium]
MNSVQIMMEEHQNILRMVKVIRKACFQIMEKREMNQDDFHKMIDFIRTYADTHHHGKEEKIMFKQMQDRLGRIGENLITHGMLVEHDLGRLHMQELEAAMERVKAGDEESYLDVIANAISYTHLIERHIKKEDELVYPFGEKNLGQEVMDQINAETAKFEEAAMAAGTQDKYMTVLTDLERKYLEA